MKHVVLITNTAKDPDGAVTARIRSSIEQNGGICTACLFKGKNSSGQYDRIDPAAIPSNTDLIISLGGDGSFLHTAKDLIDLKIPVAGINIGTLGYLTEIDLDSFGDAFQHIITGEYHIEERMLIEGEIRRKGQIVVKDIAVNDIVLNRIGTMKIINYDVLVNDRFLNSYSADGYIICTPTGSTGYNLSAGGPVADPVSEVLITTPICEHSLNSRSVVFSADARIDVIVRNKDDEDRQVKAISFDGDNDIILEHGDIVSVTKSHKKLLFLRLDKMSFVEHLGRKMR
ncbi:MAG: NAD(+)/NADH kinase [Parasporobacterium sp.]|nr:NAD(+)/NADH kinase [Parasporobacterium sp.]